MLILAQCQYTIMHHVLHCMVFESNYILTRVYSDRCHLRSIAPLQGFVELMLELPRLEFVCSQGDTKEIVPRWHNTKKMVFYYGN